NPQEFNAYRHNFPATKIDRNNLVFGFGKSTSEHENAKHKQHFGSLLGTLRPGKAGVVFESRV
ncbi:27877_t:CDS:2, partial [Racocetra persica]